MGVKKREGKGASQGVQPGEAIERAKTSTRLITDMVGSETAQSIRDALKEARADDAGPAGAEPPGAAGHPAEAPRGLPHADAALERHMDVVEALRDVVDRLEALRDVPERLARIEAALVDLRARLVDDE